MTDSGRPFNAARCCVAACMSAITCTPVVDVPDVSGEYVELYFGDTEQTLCPASLVVLDRHVERVYEFFQAKPPSDFGVPIRFESMECTEVAGCYDPSDRSIYIVDPNDELSAIAVLRHELTHAVMDSLWGNSIPFLQEGVAEVLTHTPIHGQLQLVPIGSMLDASAIDLDYAAAAGFVRFLIDTRGLDRFKRVYQAGTTRTQASVRANFADVYGENFEALESEYLAGPLPCRYQLDLCDPAAAEPVGTQWSVTLAASCADPDFYGGAGPNGAFMATQRTIMLEAAGDYRVRTAVEILTAPEGPTIPPSVQLVRCGSCDEQFERTLYDDTKLPLAAGMYTLVFRAGGDSIMSVEIERLD